MSRKNPANERIKLVYFDFLRQADGKSEPTIRQHEKAISVSVRESGVILPARSV